LAGVLDAMLLTSIEPGVNAPSQGDAVPWWVWTITLVRSDVRPNDHSQATAYRGGREPRVQCRAIGAAAGSTSSEVLQASTLPGMARGDDAGDRDGRNCAEATQLRDVIDPPKRAKMGTGLRLPRCLEWWEAPPPPAGRVPQRQTLIVGIKRRQNPSGWYRTAPPVDLTSGSFATFQLAGPGGVVMSFSVARRCPERLASQSASAWSSRLPPCRHLARRSR